MDFCVILDLSLFRALSFSPQQGGQTNEKTVKAADSIKTMGCESSFASVFKRVDYLPCCGKAFLVS